MASLARVPHSGPLGTHSESVVLARKLRHGVGDGPSKGPGWAQGQWSGSRAWALCEPSASRSLRGPLPPPFLLLTLCPVTLRLGARTVPVPSSTHTSKGLTRAGRGPGRPWRSCFTAPGPCSPRRVGASVLIPVTRRQRCPHVSCPPSPARPSLSLGGPQPPWLLPNCPCFLDGPFWSPVSRPALGHPVLA